MGNTESNVTSGVKKQTDAASQTIYKLVDLKGGGLLVELMKRATKTKQYAELDHAIKTKVEPFLYNKGQGKLIPVSQLVLLRNKERPRTKQLPILRAMEDPEDFDIDKNLESINGDIDKKDLSKYRDVCWNLKDRGAVGETILHLCLLNATSVHADLAKRLVRFYPKLINDIYMCDEYYGENVLHMAIVNEDPSMVKYLLDSGVDFHERCVGNFMCPEDQKASRTDSLDHEWVNVCVETNYEGYVYWGEYPLSFAACLAQEECYRLMLARGANPDNQDTNGNTVLHMLVIYDKQSTFDMGYEMGGTIDVRNIQNLTPLTLAAKLARRDMFFHILNIEREIYWQIGSITCAAYPLSLIDTIDIETGRINKNSALNLVVFGDKESHLELMDGVVVDLLNAKWNAFVKFRFYRQYFLFLFYFLISLVCFTLRPGPPVNYWNGTSTSTMYTTPTTTFTTPMPNLTLPPIGSHLFPLATGKVKRNTNSTGNDTVNRMPTVEATQNSTTGMTYPSTPSPATRQRTRVTTSSPSSFATGSFRPALPTAWYDDWLWNGTGNATECRLLAIDTVSAQVRVAGEIALEFGAILYIVAALREARFLGLNMFIENLMTAPSRVMFLCSCLLVLSIPFLRFLCLTETEDIVAIVVMLTIAPYFLFFCRGFKTVGPFVVMIYRMVMGDLLRFVSIYLVFVMGFSQAYYIIFLSYDNPETPPGVDDKLSNPMPNPMESIMAMFLMSLTTFSDYFEAFEHTDHDIVAKLLFVVYMAIVAILLVNMLIAMMGNTYQKIAETRNEWQRQWARIVLVVERGVSPHERLKKLMFYSQPMSDGRRALVLRLNQSEDDKEEMKEILEMKRIHDKNVRRRLKGSNFLSSTISQSPKRSVRAPSIVNTAALTAATNTITNTINSAVKGDSHNALKTS